MKRFLARSPLVRAFSDAASTKGGQGPFRPRGPRGNQRGAAGDEGASVENRRPEKFNTVRQAPTIRGVYAREVLDSRGNPTVEAEVALSNNAKFRAMVPSGASTGVYEALELRDGDKARYQGKGVLKAVENVTQIIAPALRGKNPADQQELDKLMVEILDGTKNEWGWNKAKLGANSILAVSMALARAGATVKRLALHAHLAELAGRSASGPHVLPVPSFNVINGGKHAGNLLAMQEFMVLPVGAPTFREAMRVGAEVYHALKGVIKAKYGQDAVNVGDEGGFAPAIQDNHEALNLIWDAVNKAGHADKVVLGMDVAASEFFTEDKCYDVNFKAAHNDGKGKISGEQLANLYKSFAKEFPIVSIEDPFEQDDWESYKRFTADVGRSVQIVGDDLLVTNPTRVQKAVELQACNALLLKVNQIGSVTESIEACNLAQRNGWGVMVSHRSGETEDSFIADLAVALNAGQIKSGAPCRSERLAKYNQLMRIEERAQGKAVFAGRHFRQPEKAVAGLSASA